MTELFQTDQTPQFDENKDYLAELTGPGGKFDRAKYSTERDMYLAIAKGKVYADQMVDTQNQRTDELRQEYLKTREELMTKSNVEEMLNRAIQQRSVNAEETPGNQNNPPPLDANKIDELVSQKLQAIRSADKQAENLSLVRNKLQERYGENFAAHLKKQTEALGLTEAYVTELAKNHPSVLLKAIGADQQQSQDNMFQAPPQSNRRSDTFAPTAAPKRTWAYYDNLKKQNPKIYFDPKISVQMQQDAIELGDAFYDGNFYVKGLHER